jgi:hypothetical protein
VGHLAGLNLAETRGSLLEALSAGLHRRSCPDLVLILKSWPRLLAICAARSALPEWMTVLRACHEFPSRAAKQWMMSALANLPRSPLPGLLGIASDCALARLAGPLGISGVEKPQLPSLEAGSAWADFAQWSADLSPLASSDSAALVTGTLVRRRLDLFRGASLAVLNGRVVTACRILRWLPYLDRRAWETREMSHLAAYLSRSEPEPPQARYDLAILSHSLSFGSRWR